MTDAETDEQFYRDTESIAFPKLDGYRYEIPDESFYPAFDDGCRLHLTRSTVATSTPPCIGAPITTPRFVTPCAS